MARMTRWERGFYGGIIAALTVVAYYDDPVVYREIMQNCGGPELIAVACSDPQILESSGLIRYGYVKQPASAALAESEAGGEG